jgi:hypothetical protein
VAERDERDIRDQVQDLCQQTADYLERLEGLTVYRPSPHGGPARPHRPVVTPEPYGHAGRVLMMIWEGVRRLETSLRVQVLGYRGRRRGTSAGNTADALAMIGKYARSLDDRSARKAAACLNRWIGAAQAVEGIDEARRWRHLPRDTGAALPPQCPYCKTFYLLADVDALIVACSYPDCPGDRLGNPAAGAMGIDSSGRYVVTWGDGLTMIAPSLAQVAPDLDLAS